MGDKSHGKDKHSAKLTKKELKALNHQKLMEQNKSRKGGGNNVINMPSADANKKAA